MRLEIEVKKTSIQLTAYEGFHYKFSAFVNVPSIYEKDLIKP